MKRLSIIFVLSMSPLCLNAMLSNVPDVTKWKNICQEPEKKQKLMTVYKNFCQERVKNNIPWAVGSLVPFVSRSIHHAPLIPVLVGVFAARQSYLLGRNSYRNHLAGQEDLFYLNHDVLEQLGNPTIDSYNTSTAYCLNSRYIYYDRSIFGLYFPSKRKIGTITETFRINNIAGITLALSGKERAYRIG